VPRSGAERDAIWGMLGTAGSSFWIGLDDRQEEGVFTDPYGAMPPYFGWNADEPNNLAGGADGEEGCVLMSGRSNGNFIPGRYSSAGCSNRVASVCELALLPPPSPPPMPLSPPSPPAPPLEALCTGGDARFVFPATDGNPA
jgi:hypothetical protein